ncbi:MAG: Asp-tRNA(Asn)/Glu-tRNA(Gln) amidotransferase subunit GatA [SAR324 cluster bacterium]|nr:Asp-tRNA(Asn)/Glu-tRNA(Gln) amidotransferase subunit GatA [SAR324 cluster bacterium]MBL7035497.1 Asp-tRNA(Asn)/Glu-tRNA(Gln) amidotransferase subunit GatA [SAR324 cluster bacterium]
MPFELSLIELVERIKSGDYSAAAVMDAVYDRIELYNSSLNVFRSLLSREIAVLRARQIDEKIASGKSVGKLAGIPVSIKDNICINDPDLSNSCGSKILAEYHSPYHATVVEKLLAEDALIIGTTNMDEFAMGSSTENSAYGPTLNPWDTERVPGGSSGGGAVSVACGMSLLALGSDTGGSVRQPASMCGVTGLKPTYGTVSRYGLVAYGSSLDQIGCFAQNASDCSYAFAVIAGHDVNDSTSAKTVLPSAPPELELSGLRFCLPEEYVDVESADPEVVESVNELVEMLQKQGAVVERRALEFLKYVIPTYYVLAFAEASSNLGRFDGIRYGVRKQEQPNLKSLYASSRKEGFGEEVKRRIMLGTFVLSSGYYDQYYGRAVQVRAWMEQQVEQLFTEFDFVMGPVSPFPAFKLAEKTENPLAMYLADICSVLANLTRTPAISIPGRPTKAGLPVGLQLMGRRFEDRSLLATAAAVQNVTEYHQLRPENILLKNNKNP